MQIEIVNEKIKAKCTVFSPGKRNQTRVIRMAWMIAIPRKFSIKVALIPCSQLYGRISLSLVSSDCSDLVLTTATRKIRVDWSQSLCMHVLCPRDSQVLGLAQSKKV